MLVKPVEDLIGICAIAIGQATIQFGSFHPGSGSGHHSVVPADILYALQALPVRIHKQVCPLLFTASADLRWCLPSWALRRQALHHRRVSCNVSSAHPGDVVELPPQLMPLKEADTEEQHQTSVDAQQKQVRPLAQLCSASGCS